MVALSEATDAEKQQRGPGIQGKHHLPPEIPMGDCEGGVAAAC